MRQDAEAHREVNQCTRPADAAGGQRPRTVAQPRKAPTNEVAESEKWSLLAQNWTTSANVWPTLVAIGEIRAKLWPHERPTQSISGEVADRHSSNFFSTAAPCRGHPARSCRNKGKRRRDCKKWYTRQPIGQPDIDNIPTAPWKTARA